MSKPTSEKINISTAAALLNVSTATLRDWDRSGRLKAHRTNANWRYYTKSQIRLFQEAQQKSPSV